MAVTQKLIAKELGLSVVAVSQALRNQGQLSAATRTRILEMARQLGYRPNASARAMRRGRFNSVGLMLSTRLGHSSMPERLLLHLTGQLAKHNQQLVIGQLSDDALSDQQRLPRLLTEWSCDGFLVDYTHAVPPGMITALEAQATPVVWLNAKRDMDAAYPDDFESGVRMTRELLQAGFRRVHYVCHVGPGHYSVDDRQAGYEHAMKDAGLEPMVSVESRATREQRLASVRRVLVDGKPDAILTYSSRSLGYLWHVALEMGMRLPGDLTFATWQDHPMTVGPLQLPTMVIPYLKLSEAAISMLMDKISTGTSHSPSVTAPFRFDPGDPEWLGKSSTVT